MRKASAPSVTVPNPVRDGLTKQMADGTLDYYPSENAAWIGLARYQLLVGKPHPVTAAIARMHPDDHRFGREGGTPSRSQPEISSATYREPRHI